MENQEMFIDGPVPGIEVFDMAEWVFQFDEEEPIVMAWSNTEEDPGDLTFSLKPNSGSSIIFQSAKGDKKLQIYCRRMSEERREELREQKRKNQEYLEKLNSEFPDGDQFIEN
jgi:hypothetical protein